MISNVRSVVSSTEINLEAHQLLRSRPNPVPVTSASHGLQKAKSESNNSRWFLYCIWSTLFLMHLRDSLFACNQSLLKHSSVELCKHQYKPVCVCRTSKASNSIESFSWLALYLYHRAFSSCIYDFINSPDKKTWSFKVNEFAVT